MLDGQEPQARSVQPPRLDPLTLSTFGAPEAAVIRELRDERTDVRMHAPGSVSKHAAILGHGGSPGQQMLEHGSAGLAGMNALTDLRELLRIAEQHDVSRGGTH